MIKEVIVVEGRDDAIAIKRAVDAEIIITNGYRITEEMIRRIKFAQERKGVIVFTDPDHAGERIRKKIADRVKGCKHAFLPREEATKNGDVGIENASANNIRIALEKVRTEDLLQRNTFEKSDLLKNDLVGMDGSSDRRDRLGRLLGIGYANSKQFLIRLNNYGVTREEFQNALGKI
ncbi:MAG: ribonuclease M5 [Alkaliphilus sp.]|nr:ribonuclease M5 [Alkaliphilus sp.]